jgi:hypothetical protein
MHQRPAQALTSERVSDLLTTILHTPEDRPELVDSMKLVASAYALRDLASWIRRWGETRGKTR